MSTQHLKIILTFMLFYLSTTQPILADTADTQIRAITYNVNRTSVNAMSGLVDIINDNNIDIAGFVELTRTDRLDELTLQLGSEWTVLYGGKDSSPITDPADGCYDSPNCINDHIFPTILATRYKVLEYKYYKAGKISAEFPTALLRGAVFARLGIDDTSELCVLVVHLNPYENQSMEDRRLTEITELVEASEFSSCSGLPRMIIGDLNTTPPKDVTVLKDNGDGYNQYANIDYNLVVTDYLENDLGFTDAYRAIFQDIENNPGYTNADLGITDENGYPTDYVRVDFLFVQGMNTVDADVDTDWLTLKKLEFINSSSIRADHVPVYGTFTKPCTGTMGEEVINCIPVANPGDNQLVIVNNQVFLDGSGSSDFNGGALTYKWALTSIPSGSNSILYNDTTVTPTLIPDTSGEYEVSLVVNDGNADSVAATVTVSAAKSYDDIMQISASRYHAVGVRYDGSVTDWGKNNNGQLNVTDWSNISQVSAGHYHTVGLKNDGTVVTAGNGPYVNSWSDIVQVVASKGFTVGLKSDGTVVAHGTNSDGQLNINNWTDIEQVSAGKHHTVGLKSDGTVVAVGKNLWNQTDVADWSNITQVSAGHYHTVGLKSDGTVVATAMMGESRQQPDFDNWNNIIYVSAGNEHTVALKSDGTVVAVGSNSYGQINVTEWTDIIGVSAGEFHTVGLRSDRTVVFVGNVGDF